MGKDRKDRKVALALSSGGPRGFAYIGAIEELESRGYDISSIAGTSIGSLVGGIHAAGKLSEVKQWLFSLDAWKVFSLMDISISMNHLVKGDRIIDALKEIVPDVNIEDLEIPFKAISTDFYTGEEVIFESGNLFQAIRASISIPSLFRPVKYGTRTLIDGGIANTLPLNRVQRTPGDILIGFDVNDVDVDKIRSIIREDAESEARKEQEDKERAEKTKAVIHAVRHNVVKQLYQLIVKTPQLDKRADVFVCRFRSDDVLKGIQQRISADDFRTERAGRHACIQRADK